jgi:hypothetical protein
MIKQIDETLLNYLIETISNYGVQIVICGVFIMLVIIAQRNEEQRFTSLFNKLLEESSPKDHDSVEDSKYDNLYSILHDTLSLLRESVSANRVCLFMYHNGGKNLVGIPFQKMSCISESMSTGLSSISPCSQNIPRTQYSSACNELKSHGHFWINDIKGIETTDSSLYSVLFDRMTRAIYMSAIYDNLNSNVIGFVTVEYVNRQDTGSISTIESELTKSTMKISGIMSVSSFKKG